MLTRAVRPVAQVVRSGLKAKRDKNACFFRFKNIRNSETNLLKVNYLKRSAGNLLRRKFHERINKFSSEAVKRFKSKSTYPIAEFSRDTSESKEGVRRYHADDKPFKYPTMDDCPVPQGSWQEYYDKKQKILNVQLVAGITFLVTAFTIAKTNDALYLNSGPKLPEGYVHVKYYD